MNVACKTKELYSSSKGPFKENVVMYKSMPNLLSFPLPFNSEF